ncbi:MAG: glycoside hydrolase family 16 protein [Lentimicrobiaceae bacterium]|nr:glycoside hydrolase family 16 protein [Lentimicrobiaceae bacterium]
MKRSLLLSILLLGFTIHAFSIKDTLLTSPVACKQGEWELVFADEFNAASLDSAVWITWFPYTDGGRDNCGFCRTHGNEGQVYLDENVIIADSILKIVAKNDTITWMGEQRYYSSGMIHSRYAFGQGRYEVRAKLPGGMGFWPAIWTFGQISAEVDIMEAGMQHPRRYHTSIHNWNSKKMEHNRKNVGTNLSTDFHVFAMEWDPDIIRFFIDEKEVWALSRYTSPRGRNLKKCELKPGRYGLNPFFPHPDEKLYLIINLAIGNPHTPFTKTPNEKTAFPAQMEVDWVRVYRRGAE